MDGFAWKKGDLHTPGHEIVRNILRSSTRKLTFRKSNMVKRIPELNGGFYLKKQTNGGNFQQSTFDETGDVRFFQLFPGKPNQVAALWLFRRRLLGARELGSPDSSSIDRWDNPRNGVINHLLGGMILQSIVDGYFFWGVLAMLVYVTPTLKT